MTSVAKLKGLGVKSAQWLQDIGIHHDDAFLSADPFDLYRQLRLAGKPSSLNLLYAMLGAQQGIHWQEVKQTQKTAILMQLDAMGLAPK